MEVADPARLILPESLLTVATVQDAIDAYVSCLYPILLHAPTDNGCSCGTKHDTSASGSSSTGKHPIAKNWQSHQYTRDELLDQLARLKFTPNVGIVLGKQRGGAYIIALDVDDEARFKAIEAELGPLPETARCDSGRGYRFFFEIPPEIDTELLVNVTGLGGESGVDVKVKGGQVVVAPSLHANGKRYFWSRVGAIALLPSQWGLEIVGKPEPPKWIEKYTPQTLQQNRFAKNKAARYLEVAVTRNAAALAACGEGMRNNTLFRSACNLFELCAGLYLGREWNYVHEQLLRAARTAGLAEKEVRKTLESADKRVRESGKVRTPVWLAEPAHARPAPAPGDPPAPDEESTGVAPAPPDDPWQLAPNSVRPIIKVSTELYHNVDQSIEALKKDDNLYQRDKTLVYIARVTREESEVSPHVETDDGALHRQMVEGSPQICEMRLPTIRERLSKAAVFQKYVESSDRWKPILPTDAIVGAVHDRKEWAGIQTLVGIVETPTFCPGGIIVQTPGFDARTGYEYIPSETFPTVNDEVCTQENAQYYFKMLSDVFADFRYVSPAHRSVPIAAILTLIARPSIHGSVPAVLFDASTRGSGKTLQTDVIATVTTGRGAPRMNYTLNEEELEKILGGYALNGAPFICLDNVPTMRPFGGGPLDRCLTAKDKVHLRVLGRTEILSLTWRALIMATGNNMTLYGDTARRVLMARLEPQEESPERRTNFKYDDLLAFVRTQRPRLVAAALLILKAYHRVGRPDMGCARWGSFEEWSRLIPHAIRFAGGEDPMKARPECDEEVDVEAQALANVLDQLPLLHQKLKDFAPESVGDIGIAARTMVTALYEQNPEWPEFEPLREAVETLCKSRSGKHVGKPDAIQLGYKLRSMRSRVVNGKKLMGRPGDAHVTMWKVEPAGVSD
jgi:hypothetical protein